MKTVTIYESSINDRLIDEVVKALEDGKLIVYPTDTVYAVGCDATNNHAIERVCRLKGINPQKQHLSIVCHDLSQASEYARIDNRAFSVIRPVIPGPFTFILPASTRLPKVFKGRREVGVRIPANAIARAIAAALGRPLLSTSVSLDDPEDMERPEAIAMHYEHSADMMVDGGEGGTQLSTIVDLTDSSDPQIVRQGAGMI